jgi:hypothetical protein
VSIPTPDAAVLLDRLWEQLEPLPSERVVLSAAYARGEGGPIELCYASLLLGPTAMATTGWSDWKRRHLAPQIGLLPPGDHASFVHDGGEWLAGRAALTQARARRWLNDALLEGVASAIGPLPAARCALQLPASPVQARYPNRTPASRFVMNTVRPVLGYLFPAPGAPELQLPQWWPAKDPTVVVPFATALGIDLPTDSRGDTEAPAKPGLLLARVSRSAWINSVRYDKDTDEFILGIWLEPKRADLYGLVLEIREYVEDDLAFAARTPLADLRIPTRARGRVSLSLPTLGRGVKRSVNLYDRDGTLLDHLEPFTLIEAIHFTLTADGGQTTFTVGDARARAMIAERLQAFDQVEERYRELLRSGLPRRVVQDRKDAVGYMRQRLANATGELLILDPYFGHDAQDFTILEGVSVPVRILRGPERVSPPASQSNVQIRRFVAQRQPVPFHDRLYIWGQTGLSVGTSPSGFGNRVARIDEVARLESEAWRELFDRWWTSADFTP